MANRFWVTGGTGSWNSTTNWSATSGGASGASVPGATDAAILDASSGSVTVTLDISTTIQTLTCTGFTGTLAFGTNTISLNSTGTIFTGATTMTVTGTPLIICTDSSATTRTISPGAVTEANSISFRVTAGTGAVIFTTAQSVRDLDFTDGVNPTGFAGVLGNSANTLYGNLKASTGMTVTVGTGTWTFAATSGTKTINTAGVTFDKPFIFNGVGGTWQLQDALTSGSTRTVTLSNGTLDLNGYTLTSAAFSSSNSNIRTIAFGATGKFVLINSAGSLWTTSTATNLTVTGTAPLIQGTTAATTGTRTITMGAAGETNAISVDVTAGSDTIALAVTTGAYNNINFTGFTGIINFNNSIAVYGNFDAGNATAMAGAASPQFASTSGTKTITSNGKTFPLSVTFNGIGGTWSLQDALSLTSTLTLINGTLTTNGYAVTTSLFTSNNTNVRALNLGASTVTITGSSWNTPDVTNLTTDASGTISMSSASAKTFNGGGGTWSKLLNSGAGALTITGANTFMELGNSVSPTSFVFLASTTTSAYAYSINGTASNLVSLRSSTPGTQYTLAKL